MFAIAAFCAAAAYFAPAPEMWMGTLIFGILWLALFVDRGI